MKILKFPVYSLLIVLGLSACKDDDGPYTCSSCVDSPEALSVNNSSGKGIYKGVVMGSSGTIKFNISNNDNTISGILVIDDKTIPLTTEAVFDDGLEGYFNGHMNEDDDVQIYFVVNGNGESYDAQVVSLPGHTNVTIQIAKELSIYLIEGFQGTYTSSADGGVFNLLLYRDEDGDGQWASLSNNSIGYVYFYYGEIDSNHLTGGTGDFVIDGTLSGDNVSGTWEDNYSNTAGTWKGKRTL